MGASNGLAFLPLFAILSWLGVITSWFLNRTGETELGLDPVIGELNLEFSSELTSRGVELSLSLRLTSPGVWKMRAASVTLAFGSTVWRGLKISCVPTTLAVMSGLIGTMTTGIIFGKTRLINNFCLNRFGQDRKSD